jgi:hypothetical protein
MIRSTVRHEKFDELVDALAESHPVARQAIDGALWEIERWPERGVYISEIDAWQARLIIPPPVLLIYTFNRRYVYMLTMLPGD